MNLMYDDLARAQMAARASAAQSLLRARRLARVRRLGRKAKREARHTID
jgi:hypothetical protein